MNGLDGTRALPPGLCWLATGVLVSAVAAGTHDPNRTATIFVHGFSLDGAQQQSVYGDDVPDPLLDVFAGLLDLPTINDPDGVFAPNVVAATTYYGDTPPAWYTPQDIAEVESVTELYGGGIPRYATIVAKYARHVMERSGAQQVNFASASMGSLVTRWLIEKDVEGLASEGRVARWLSLEGVIAGNWAVSSDELADLWEFLGSPAVDLAHMTYAWIETNLHAPRTEADTPLLGGILMHQTGSTDDGDGALTSAMLLWGGFQPNDGVQGVLDSFYLTVTPRSQFMDRLPTWGLHHVTHVDLPDHEPAAVQAAAFLTQRRRVTITLTRAQVTDIQEPDFWFWDWTPAEVVFESHVRSPEATRRWSMAEPVASRHREGASTPVWLFDHDGHEQFLEHSIFDDFVLEGETTLLLELWAEDIDWDIRYGIFEPLGEVANLLGSVALEVPVTQPGSYTFQAEGWNGDLQVEVFDYPFARLGGLGDLDGDGTVDADDLLALLAAWGPCPNPGEPCQADLDGDGEVGTSDLLILLANWG